MLRPFAYPVARCWELLRKVWNQSSFLLHAYRRKNSQHYQLDVTCYVRLHTLLHVVACCWELSRKVWKPVKLFAPCKQTQHWELLCPFARSSKSQLWCFKGIQSAMFRRTLHAKAQWIIPWIWIKKDILIFLKNLFGTKRTVSVDSDTILNYKLFRFLFLPFFYSSPLSVFDIKMKIECKGVRTIYYSVKTRTNQRLRSAGNNDGRWKLFYSNAVHCPSFTW